MPVRSILAHIAFGDDLDLPRPVIKGEHTIPAAVRAGRGLLASAPGMGMVIHFLIIAFIDPEIFLCIAIFQLPAELIVLIGNRSGSMTLPADKVYHPHSRSIIGNTSI